MIALNWYLFFIDVFKTLMVSNVIFISNNFPVVGLITMDVSNNSDFY